MGGKIKKFRILIESNKIVSPDNDGVKRYQIELLKGYLPLLEKPDPDWEIDLYINGEIVPLLQFKDILTKDFSVNDLHVKNRQVVKSKPTSEKVVEHHQVSTSPIESRTEFQQKEQVLLNLIPRGFVRFLEKNDIRILHNTYEFFKKGFVFVINLLIRLANKTKEVLYPYYQKLKSINQGDEIIQRMNSYDLIHLPLKHHYTPFKKVTTKVLTTVHDLTHIVCPEFHIKINIVNSENGMNFILKSNSDVIAVSNSTKQDLLKEYKIAPEKIYMIYEAADRIKFNFRKDKSETKKIREKYGIGELDNYLICLSTIEPRKNLENTLKGFKLLLEENPGIQLYLVIAGKKGWQNNEAFYNDPAYLKNVVFIGFVEDEDISAIYSDALAMSYLSFYEGFGLPPLEAMCCSTPVIFGNNSSLIEVVGAGGLACDPYDVNEIKDKFGQMYFDKKLRAQKSKEALKQSLQFSWDKAVVETLEVYKQIIDRK